MLLIILLLQKETVNNLWHHQLHGYIVHQWYQTLYCPTNEHNVKNVIIKTI